MSTGQVLYRKWKKTTFINSHQTTNYTNIFSKICQICTIKLLICNKEKETFVKAISKMNRYAMLQLQLEKKMCSLLYLFWYSEWSPVAEHKFDMAPEHCQI